MFICSNIPYHDKKNIIVHCLEPKFLVVSGKFFNFFFLVLKPILNLNRKFSKTVSL